LCSIRIYIYIYIYVNDEVLTETILYKVSLLYALESIIN
jgi:hypothetical protein